MRQPSILTRLRCDISNQKHVADLTRGAARWQPYPNTVHLWRVSVGRTIGLRRLPLREWLGKREPGSRGVEEIRLRRKESESPFPFPPVGEKPGRAGFPHAAPA